MTWSLRLFAAVASGGRCAVASHRSAAQLLAIPRFDANFIEVLLPRRRSATDLGGKADEVAALVRRALQAAA